MKHTLFISDLHLCEARPEPIAAFESLLAGLDEDTEMLYILGDLFEFWHGDDDLTETNQRIITAIKAITDKGIPVYFQRGNRDFLAGKQFAQLTGAALVPDYQVVDLYGTKTLIMHGDLLCTDDVAYQRMRKVFSFGALRWLYLHLPLALRRLISGGVRNISKKGNTIKAPEIMDVTQATVGATLQTYNVRELIHGHTHRPAIHDIELPDGKARRIVLGDWYETDSVLVYGEDRQALMSVSEFLDRKQT